ncbi:NAD-dependent epimerase/dehydratase family protein [Ancylobacter vacuolatus]|uniref:UDP-glucose 4-epimerase n=1 Tax=Ancylobacter vacuolatus TaxID=223389 RepID=A0ABU0DDJ7_9HYPH|nr:UDP-glucose 4-epimerase [Ancylobacter vacuolatus]
MKTLVIGGCGFIGSHVVDRLRARGHSVKVLDRQPERFRPPVEGVEYLVGDFSDQMVLIEALAGVEAVLHLAGTTVPGTADLNPALDVQGNLIGTLGLLDAMSRVGVSRLLFLSSGGTVYGRPDQVPIPETHPLRPINSYGIVKVAIEHYLDLYGRTRGLSPVTIRASNPYGPRQGHAGVQGVISTFLTRLRQNEPIEIWGDGSVVRDYVYVTELADLCARAVATDRTGPYNAGSGQGTSLNEIIAILHAVTGRDIAPLYRPGRALDVCESILDVSRAKADFGWESTIPLREGVRATYEWMAQAG